MPVKSPEILEVIHSNPIAVTNRIAEPKENQNAIAEGFEPSAAVKPIEIPTTNSAETTTSKPEISSLNATKVSALSLASIRAKKELAESNKAILKKDEVHLTEAFSETDMLLQWNKYAQRLADKGHKIMESFLLINDPKLDGTTIIHELPNDGSRIEFESEKHDLVGYLRGKLHNHDIDIKIVVNESMDSRKAFTPQDRYNRLNEINPSLDLLRKTFDLDI